ncbi:MAG: hypothetical protein JSS79_16000 [Bacteroidetes bacterium]|nr:hypothetical protein [Bacteroidota bacterium]
MSLKVREQFPEFEVDEFTEEKELTLDETINALKEFNWTEEYSKSVKIIEQHAEPSIWLKNQCGDKLSIYWAENNKFAIYFSPKMRRSSTSIVNGLDQVDAVVKLFDRGERHLLLNRLRTSEYHHKTHWFLDLIQFFIHKNKTRTSREIVKEEFVYQMKNLSIIKKLTFSLLFFLMPSTIWVYSYLVNNKPFNLTAFLGIQTFMTLMATPGIIIAINHWRKNGRWNVYFRKGDNKFIIVSPTGKEIFDKVDFTKRSTTVNDSHAPWNSFEYTTLIKNTGEQIHFSNLLIPTSDFDKLFGRIEETRCKSGFQIIKDKKIKD